MLMLFLAAAAATPSTAVDAERAFSRDARRSGEWTASRAYADEDAVIFTPQAIWARDFLKGRKNPPAATSWSPNRSYMSCDGRIAVNTGPWHTAKGEQGGFCHDQMALDAEVAQGVQHPGAIDHARSAGDSDDQSRRRRVPYGRVHIMGHFDFHSVRVRSGCGSLQCDSTARHSERSV